ncbi:LysE family translocator [Flocculibacter collagenilyticus]|uniref:LysE family translocator n=1 Tax=Flocculibacter collagenilyticus TaxID=2744479 RepID=UPI0018F37479|nr:LysE family translocator [Flocculibacter collagenilyticus]
MISAIAPYWAEFLTIVVLHLLAVASPGPDFAVVLNHSLLHGRRVAYVTSIGVALGILVHVTYSLVGIGIVLQTTPWLLQMIQVIGALYLGYLGFLSLKAALKERAVENPSLEQIQTHSSAESTKQHNPKYNYTAHGNPKQEFPLKKAFMVGFLTNGLNPKATLFFVSLFSIVVSVETTTGIKAFYGIYMAIATGLWFCGLSYFLGSVKVREWVQRNSYIVNGVFGVLLLAIAIKLVLFEF